MKKSEQQLKKELGSWHNIKGYFFISSCQIYPNFYWSGSTIKGLEYNIFVNLGFYGGIKNWRTQQGDWRSVDGLVLYDRFGSKITFIDSVNYITKLTDVGKHYDNLSKDYLKNIEKIKQLEIQFPIKLEE
jgi:hypothetical protein